MLARISIAHSIQKKSRANKKCMESDGDEGGCGTAGTEADCRTRQSGGVYAVPWRNSSWSVRKTFTPPQAWSVHISFHHQDLIQNTFELRSVYTAKIQNPNSRQKLGRRVAPPNESPARQTQNLQGFSTLRVAPRCQCKFKNGNIELHQYQITRRAIFILEYQNG